MIVCFTHFHHVRCLFWCTFVNFWTIQLYFLAPPLAQCPREAPSSPNGNIDPVYNRKIIHWFQKLFALLKHLYAWVVIWRQKLHLGVKLCRRFKAVSILFNISYKTYKSIKSPIVLQNYIEDEQKSQMFLSQCFLGVLRDHLSKHTSTS